MASCKEWWLADSMKGAGALAGCEGQEERKREGSWGFPSCLTCRARLSRTPSLATLNQIKKVHLLASPKVLKLWRGGENGTTLYLLFQASIAALPRTLKSLWERTPCKEWGERGAETLEATELKNWHAGTVNYSRPAWEKSAVVSLALWLPLFSTDAYQPSLACGYKYLRSNRTVSSIYESVAITVSYMRICTR